MGRRGLTCGFVGLVVGLFIQLVFLFFFHTMWEPSGNHHFISANIINNNNNYNPRCPPAVKSHWPSENAVDIKTLTPFTSSQHHEYLFEKWREASAEVKRLVILLRGDKPTRPPHVGVEIFKQHPSCAVGVDSPPKARRRGVSVGTFNLWNVSPPWPKRRKAIAKLLLSSGLEIIGLQEIRKFEGENQLIQLIQELEKEEDERSRSSSSNNNNHHSQKKQRWHYVYEKIQTETVGEEEGLGIISRFEIKFSELIPLTPEDPSKKRTRGLLRAVIAVDNGEEEGGGDLVDFSVTHFGIDDEEQCHSAVQVLTALNQRFHPSSAAKKSNQGENPISQIVVGDFNTFFDFQWPMDFLTASSLAPSHFLLSNDCPCQRNFLDYLSMERSVDEQVNGTKMNDKHPRFRDVWAEIYPSKDYIRLKNLVLNPNLPGHTFPNAARNSDVLDFCRPDRVLIRGDALIECDIALFGDQVLLHNDDDDGGHKPAIVPSDHLGVVTRLIFARSQEEDKDFETKKKEIQTWKFDHQRDNGALNNIHINQQQLIPPSSDPKIPSRLSSSLIPYGPHSLSLAFDENESSYFWGSRSVVKGDYFHVHLLSPFFCDAPSRVQVSVATGWSDRGSLVLDFLTPKDFLLQGVLYISSQEIDVDTVSNSTDKFLDQLQKEADRRRREQMESLSKDIMYRPPKFLDNNDKNTIFTFFGGQHGSGKSKIVAPEGFHLVNFAIISTGEQAEWLAIRNIDIKCVKLAPGEEE